MGKLRDLIFLERINEERIKPIYLETAAKNMTV
jgi:hypothetical protein